MLPVGRATISRPNEPFWLGSGLALRSWDSVFVVARFGLFLQALSTGQSNYQARSYGLSFWFGTGLIVLGVVVNVFSARSHIRLIQQLQSDSPAVHRVSTLAIAIATILAVLGLAMAIYLIKVRDPIPAHA